MGRDFRYAAVVKAYDAGGAFLMEDIVPLESFRISGSYLLNSTEFRSARGIRFISFRVFDEDGNRAEQQSFCYNLQGEEVSGLHRRPDGTIIEDPDWV